MANDADTPVSDDKEKTPPVGTDTPAENQKEEPTSSSPQEKRVKELEGKVETLNNQLTKQETIAKTAQRKEKIEAIERKKVEVRLKKIRDGEVEIENEEPEMETSGEKEIRLKAKSEIMGLILDSSEYQEILAKDITLKQVLRNNPFALISDYLDSEDAVEQVKDVLDKRVLTLKAEEAQSQSKEEPKEGEGKEFETGAVQPSEDKEGSADDKKSVDEPLILNKVEESIRSKIHIT